MRVTSWLAVLALAGMTAANAGGPVFISTLAGYDLTGPDYRQVPLGATQGPDYCSKLCGNDDACAGYTYVKPGGGPGGLCKLKRVFSLPPKADPCCTSGLKSKSQEGPVFRPQ